MQDNSTDDTIEMLIRYMDGEMDAAERSATEKLLQDDAAIKERYENLIAAKEAIRSQGLRERVRSLHQQFYNELEEVPPAKIVKPSFGARSFLRIAAILILVLAGYSTYQYATTNNNALYKDNFTSYELPVTRSEQQTDNIDSLYSENNYSEVITAVNERQSKTQKDYFLLAQSYLQTNNAKAAILAFENLEQLNGSSSEKYFVQETDYYLALAYIKTNDIDAAEKQLEKIRSNKQHMFYSKAKEISTVELMILKWKQ